MHRLLRIFDLSTENSKHPDVAKHCGQVNKVFFSLLVSLCILLEKCKEFSTLAILATLEKEARTQGLFA